MHHPYRAVPAARNSGVVAREITLLPRHWDWLAQQPGGASVAIRRLVDEARRTGEDKRSIVRVRRGSGLPVHVSHGRQQAALRRGDPRAICRRRRSVSKELIAGWPADVRDHALRLADAGISSRIPRHHAG
jgi:hypothetical protein